MNREQIRASQLNKRFHDVLHGRVTVQPQNARHFLEGLCAQEDPAKCVSDLVASPRGSSSIQNAMRFDLSPQFLNGPATNVLEYLLRAANLGGGVLDHILIFIVEPPFFWLALSREFERGELVDRSQLVFAKLLDRLLALTGRDTAPYRELASKPSVINSLIASPNQEIREIAHHINHILAAFASGATPSGPGGPGGRHDNDFTNFRDISILPTADEILSKQPPFIRPATVLEDPKAADTRVADYLDNTFRMLREDMIYEMREELQIALGKKPGKHRGLHIDGLSMIDVHTGSQDRGTRWGLMLRCHRDFWQLKAMKDHDDRKDYLTNDYAGSKILRHQSLACLIADGDIISFATVFRVEELLAKNPPVVVLQLDGEASTSKTLLRLSTTKKVQLLQIDIAIFAYQPVLKALRNMQLVPLSDEILFWEEGDELQTPTIEANKVTRALSIDPSMDLQSILCISKSVHLDSSQAESLLAGLKQRVSLIQGPPGTGKSFIGALLAKALHDHTSQTIIVVCYTNHALDQFLTDLCDIGIAAGSIVRIGGRASPGVQHLTLQSQKRTGYTRSKAEWTLIDQTKSQSSFLDTRLQSSFQALMNADRTVSLDDILTHMEFDDPELWEAFRVPLASDGSQIVGKKGKVIKEDFLLWQWSNGWDAGMFKNMPNVQAAASVWNMDLPSRKALLAKWKGDIIKDLVDDICKVGRDYNTAQDELTRKFGESTVAFLKQKRIIGCTTTGAAKYAEDLAAVSPDVLLVEEAGEILESHVLTALGPKTNQIILIGDHKQLRPKVNNYQLTVEKGEGYDLNRSLFERLVLKEFPHQTLTTQHRMRPEISAFIRELTYPELVDHTSTLNRPDIRGVQSNVIFVDHSLPEDEETRITDRGDAGSISSKQNTYEVEMVLKIVRYLKQQGYKSENMVILTPYLGQLYKLRDMLKNDHDPVLNELDSNDLQKAGLLASVATESRQPGIRLATIDNYQGEESNIVIASLTRSNPNNAIGFMDSPERLNVLLSRARDGLILIGNSHTFLNSKRGGALWGDLFSLLRKGKHVFEGFPIKCERHPTRTLTIKQATEFDDQSPDGGCTQPCDMLLQCQVHKCPKKCHPLRKTVNAPAAHLSTQCKHPFQDKCPAGVHTMSWKCHQGRPASCSLCAAQAKRLEKQAMLDIQAQEKRDAAQHEYDMKMTELQAKLQYQQEAMSDVQVAKDRENEIKQKEKEIEAAKQKLLDAEAAAKKLAGKKSAAQSTSGPSHSASQSHSQPEANGTAQTTSTPRPTFPSPARDKWENQKRVDGAQNNAIDEIMDMTGLEQVKEQILRIKGNIDTMNRQGVPINKERLNLVLLGNPGTGKTTVARLYAQFLESIKALPGNAFLETTGSKLSFEGVQGAQKMIDDALKAGGGAIFIDEAYQLVSEHDQSGRQVLDFLLAEMENQVGTLVFILAGYNKQMEKFFEHNPGLPSRVPYQLQFADYTDAELITMLEDLVHKRYNGRMRVEDGIKGLYARIAIKRLGRGRGRPGFGNARALQNMFAKIRERQAERVEKERRAGSQVDDFLLTKKDLIGPDPSQVLPNSVPWAKLQGLIGLESVKDSVRNFFALLETNYERELAEKEPMQMSLNRVFLGSPGTGKTSVAKLYGQILADLGLLSNGEVVVKNPADFVGAHLGQSEQNTKAILESTRGKVLVIDEAYMLYSKNSTDPYKTSVIDTMVAEIQSVPGEDRCVLLLGYKEQMEEMFQNVNPGLARRFAIENAFSFEDFTEPQLMKILDYKLKDQDLSATDDAKQVAGELLSRMRNRPNFGNAGEVENLLGQAKSQYQKRMTSVPASQRMDVVFEPQDFDPDFNRGQNASGNLAKMFSDVVGCEDVIQKLDGYQKIARAMKEKGLDMRAHISSNFVFKGPPGTGKTTTARKLGQVYYDMGFLASAEVVECSATDLVGQYVGHTGPKTKGVFEKALGKVLFIDEAYRLSEGHFAKEAMDEIVGLMTNERFMNKLVIILAGYDHEMNALLSVNPGLSSRFAEEINFRNMSPEHCLALLDKDLRTNSIIVAELADKTAPEYKQMQDMISQMSELPSWGNGRDVKTLGKRMTQKAFSNMASGGDSASLTAADALSIMKATLDEQLARQSVARIPSSGSAPMASMSGPAPPPPSTSTSTSQSSKRAPPPPPPSSPPDPSSEQPPSQETPRGDMSAGPRTKPQTSTQHRLARPVTSPRLVQRDAGVSDAVWNQLQADIAAETGEKKKAAEEERKLQQELKKVEKQGHNAKAETASLERARKEAKDDPEKQQEIERQLEEARRREEQVKAARERAAVALKKKRKEEEEKRRKELEMQQKLEEMGLCPAGFRWIRQASGYRCSGGSHFISGGQLGM
ncbi:P-loop containing nucleoside triphosphate hydrolase protein [Gyrodon lividus]|nr:P-loop containing nucleoside triphosphate hydrolase protein [Gyrodon lividus]